MHILQKANIRGHRNNNKCNGYYISDWKDESDNGRMNDRKR